MLNSEQTSECFDIPQDEIYAISEALREIGEALREIGEAIGECFGVLLPEVIETCCDQVAAELRRSESRKFARACEFARQPRQRTSGPRYSKKAHFMKYRYRSRSPTG